ncbi:MAG: class I SAM-dependent methyltransferase [Flammeovirgaceae bacterium]|nr:class I SAM-dependent methyltransferase [Flammeovirgaceae bacterium]
MRPLYIHSTKQHNLDAPRQVVPLLLEMMKPTNVLDVGCGIGTWLKAFEELGITDYVGLDGDYVDKSLMKIPLTNFTPVDLRNEWNLNQKFDLVISLEVAEHLPEQNANSFVESITQHGDSIVFSAAIPHQGGQRHLNEQWPAYWQRKFEVHGFYFHDVIRPLIWDNPSVDWWYKQNMFLINRTKPIHPVKIMVHPECLANQALLINQILNGSLGVKESFKIFVRSLIGGRKQTAN